MTASIDLVSASLGGSLEQLLMADDLVPGSEPSYQLCKTIYLYHPLGAKMVEKPLRLAMSQRRKISVQDAPLEVVEAFETEWDRLKADNHIFDTMRLSRIYGVSAVVLLEDGKLSNKPLDLDDVWKRPVAFNVLDALNTAGSLVLSQVPTDPAFNKPVTVSTNGQQVHPTRFEVILNEQPIYLSYTPSAYGFSGRSIYQRALFPLKSYISGMLANDMILTKLGVLVMKMEAPGSIIDAAMQKVAALKRTVMKALKTYQVVQIGKDEDAATLNMQNVDGAGKFARDNILKDIASSMDAPAKFLDDETFASGLAEGSEDAKNIVHFLEGERRKMAPLYRFFDKVCMHRAWSPELYDRLKNQYPDWIGERSYQDCFYEWQEAFVAEWPSLLIEPESEVVEVEKVKVESILATAQTLLDKMDPDNQLEVVRWVADNISENKKLYPHTLDLDYDALKTWLAEEAQRKRDQQDSEQEDNDLAKTAGKMKLGG